MTYLFHRSLNNTPPTIVGGLGINLWDGAGNTYIDASGGAAVSCLGHAHPAVIAAIKNQVDEIAYAHTGFFTSEPAEKLAANLVQSAPDGLNHVLLVSGGSEAVEAAIKMARQYYIEKGYPQRYNIIARKQSYHGNTLGALATGGNIPRRENFLPLLIQTHHIDPCFYFRYSYDQEDEACYAERAARSLENKILELGPETVMAFVAETVVGATSGAVPAVLDYFKKIREICDRYGILLILDEVMCGMGRTGYQWAFEAEGIQPDICTIAKGLGGGYQPIGAVIATDEIYDAMKLGSGSFRHGHTYMAHPTAAAAALAVQETIQKENLLSGVKERGDYFAQMLRSSLEDLDCVGDIRGRGLLWGVELVQNKKDGNRPFSPSENVATKLKKTAFKNGLIIYPNSGTINGRDGDHILLAPPFIISHNEIDNVVAILKNSIKETMMGIANV